MGTPLNTSRFWRGYLADLGWVGYVNAWQVLSVIFLFGVIGAALLTAADRKTEAQQRLPDAVIQDRLGENRERIKDLEDWKTKHLEWSNAALLQINTSITEQKAKIEGLDKSIGWLMWLVGAIGLAIAGQVLHTVFAKTYEVRKRGP